MLHAAGNFLDEAQSGVETEGPERVRHLAAVEETLALGVVDAEHRVDSCGQRCRVCTEQQDE